MLTLVHIADVHLGAEYSFLPAQQARAFQEAQLLTLRRVIEHAADISAEVILIAGDLFDSPTPPAQLSRTVFELLKTARCPVLISPGNHDHLCPESPYLSAALPDNVFVFQSPRLTPYYLHSDTVIWGAAFAGTTAFIPLDAPLDESHLNLLLLHGDLKGASGYNPINPGQLADSGFAYAAFGHNHSFSGLRRLSRTIYACTGSLMGLSQEDVGEKGFLSGAVDRDGASLRFRKLTPSRYELKDGQGRVIVHRAPLRFEHYEIPMDRLPDDRALAQAVRKRITEDRDFICATYSLVGEKHYQPGAERLEAALRDVYQYCFVRDRARVHHDPWESLGDDDLRGAVTRRFRDAYEAAETDELRRRVLRSLSYALAALDGETEAPA